MEKQFVTKEIAEQLKLKGFDEPCYANFRNLDDALIMCTTGIAGVKYSWIHESPILAPLWQQVIEWFREKHQIFIEVEKITFNNDCYLAKVRKFNKNNKLVRASNYDDYITHYKTMEMAVKKALTLIK